MSSLPFQQVCIVGGGNAAHALAALLPSKGIRTVWYLPYQDEAERIRSSMQKNDGKISATFAAHNVPSGVVEGAPMKVSKDAAEVIPESDVVLLPLPSFAYGPVLAGIREHIRPGTFVGVTPGQGGFDWTAKQILGREKCGGLVFFAIMPMPFNCRITSFGKAVDVQTLKRHYRLGAMPQHRVEDCLAVNRALFGDTVSVGHFLNCTLYPINAIIHPQRLYALCKDWTPDGPPLQHNPLFYEDMDELSTHYMDLVNQELIQVCTALTRQGLQADVGHIYDFLKWVYKDIADVNNMVDLFANNDAYKGFRCPFIKLQPNGGPGGYIPDFQNRYFTEDIPMGLCIYKGVADIAGVDTPMMDRVLEWAQKYMGKQYIVNGKLVGKHVNETTAPQRFGMFTVEDLINGDPKSD